MGLFNLYRFYFAFAFISLVVSPVFAQNKWGVTKPSITTDYYVLDQKTIPMRSAPTGRDVMVIDRATTGNSSFSVPRSGEQTIQQRGTIEAVNKSTSIKGRFKWADFQIREGLKTAWRVGKVTPQALLFTAIVDIGIEKGIEWYTGDDGNLYFKPDVHGGQYVDCTSSTCPSVITVSGIIPSKYTSDPQEACLLSHPKGSFDAGLNTAFLDGTIRIRDSSITGKTLDCGGKVEGRDRQYWDEGGYYSDFGQCSEGSIFNGFGCIIPDGSESPTLVPQSEIFSLIDTLVADDFTAPQFEELIKTAELDTPSDFVITGIDPVQGDVSETVITDEITGDEIIIKDSNYYDFDIQNSNGNPTVTGSTTNKKDTYTNGSLTGSSNTTSVAPPFVGDNPAPDTGDIKVELDIEECRDFPESCAYYDFMKEDFSPPDDVQVDFDGIDMGDIDLSSSFQYDFDLGVSASCPSPMVIDLGSFGSPTISYEPLCEVAEDTRPFVLTSAIIFSIMILLGSARKV